MIESRHEYYNQNFTFKKFIVTPENQSTYKASLQASQRPGKIYNPLVICSPVGAGKTHLLYAMVNKAKFLISRTRILFITSQDFTNVVIKSIKNGTVEVFRENCNYAKLVLLDSIQYIANKERTQEELYRLCATFLEQKKQIAVSSDYPLKKCQGISAQLQELFAKGLTVCIQPPSTELKMSILMDMAESEKIELPEEVASLLSRDAGTNIRMMQVFLMKLISYARQEEKPINLELVKRIMQ